MRLIPLLSLLVLTGCASVFDSPYPMTDAGKMQALDDALKHVDMQRIERLDSVLYVGHPMDVAWLCKQVGATGNPRGCQFTTLRDGLPDPVIVVSRDDRTGEADPMVLAHELCHVRGGTERECARLGAWLTADVL